MIVVIHALICVADIRNKLSRLCSAENGAGRFICRDMIYGALRRNLRVRRYIGITLLKTLVMEFCLPSVAASWLITWAWGRRCQ